MVCGNVDFQVNCNERQYYQKEFSALLSSVNLQVICSESVIVADKGGTSSAPVGT